MTDPQDFFDLPRGAARPAPPGAAETAARPARPDSALAAVAPLLRLRYAPPREILERGLDLLLAATGGQRGFLVWLGPEGEPRGSCSRGLAGGPSLTGLLARPNGLLAEVMKGAPARVVTDPALASAELAGWAELARGVSSFVCLRADAALDDARGSGLEPALPGPALTGPRGRMLLYADIAEPGRSLAPRAIERAREAGEIVRCALEQAEAFARLALDSETGLPSRAALLHELSRALGNGPMPVSLLLCGLDGAPDGRRAGSPGARLRAMADLLRATLPAHALAARYGGSEFAVLAPGVGPEAAAVLAEGVRGTSSAAGSEEARPGRVSIGVATSPDGRTEPQDLIRRAEQAAAAARRAGGDRVLAWSLSLAEVHARIDRLAGLLTQPAPDPRRLGRFVDLARTGPTGTAEEALTAEVLEILRDALGARRIAAFVPATSGFSLVEGITAGGEALDRDSPVAEELIRDALQDGRPARYSGPEAELLGLDPAPPVSEELSVLCAPLVRAGGVIALLYLESDSPGGFTADDLSYAEAAAGLLAARIGPSRPRKGKRKKA